MQKWISTPQSTLLTIISYTISLSCVVLPAWSAKAINDILVKGDDLGTEWWVTLKLVVTSWRALALIGPLLLSYIFHKAIGRFGYSMTFPSFTVKKREHTI